MGSYLIGDVATQERLLAQQLKGFSREVQFEAFTRLHKRVVKHYGLGNRYLGDGSLRQEK